MLGYTTDNRFQVRMPIGDPNSTVLNLVVRIRDIYDSFIEINMSSISVISDTIKVTEFMNTVISTFDHTINESRMSSNPFIQILYGNGYENDICQWFNSISQLLNNQAQQNLQRSIQSMLIVDVICLNYLI